MALSAKNKLGFIDGTVEALLLTDANYATWKRGNDTVKLWILNSLSDDVYSSMMFIKSARDIWIELKDQFSLTNGPRIFQLQQSISDLAQGQMNIANSRDISYFFESLADYQNRDYVMKFLMGLNESYGHIKSQILLTLPPINKVFALLVQEERQREISSVIITEPTAMLGRATGNQGNKQSHGKKERPMCSHCGLLGHTAEKCYKLHGYPLGYKSRYKQNAPSANQVALATNAEQSSEVQ
ncbi:uncharacterized protein LOC131160917 [Malania oleifera]|uniref:uncharacterized protein LOC131160917 n=1 Tax=Malania oleifera TaxID=397392 RepID=UPI0025AE1C0B|nr:uncharacterized protein LOC131160917 [Malania oleifera]